MLGSRASRGSPFFSLGYKFLDIADWCESARNWVRSHGVRAAGQSASHLISIEKAFWHVVEFAWREGSFLGFFPSFRRQKSLHRHRNLFEPMGSREAGIDGLDACRALNFSSKLACWWRTGDAFGPRSTRRFAPHRATLRESRPFG